MMRNALAIAIILAGCGAERPATVRAVAVGMGALGTGAATSAAACINLGEDVCSEVALTSAIIVLGTAVSAAAVAFLGYPATVAPIVATSPAVAIVEPLPAPTIKPLPDPPGPAPLP